VIRVVPLEASVFPQWAGLFERAASPCHCRYWHYTGTKNDWLARCAMTPEVNRAEHEAALAAGDPGASGLVALDGDAAVGWMKVTPRASVPKLRKLPVYRALDLGPDEGTFSIGCFLVDPAHRRRGVARALVHEVDAFVRARGGRAVEAYPRRAREPLHAEEAWMGPEHLFIEHGFVPVHDDRLAGPVSGTSPTSAYPVYRKVLVG
jgi:GNAT superfamily N-acetyltransferase